MGRPARPVQRITLSVRFEPDEIALIDEVRGLMTRQDFVAGVAIRAARHATDQPIEARSRPVGAPKPSSGATKLALTSPEASANALPPASPRYNRGASSPLVVMTPKSEIPRKSEVKNPRHRVIPPPAPSIARKRPDDATLKAMPAWQRKQFGWD